MENKVIKLIVFILLLGGISYFSINLYIESSSTINALKTMNYTDDEIKLIKKLNPSTIEYLSENYISNIENYLNDSNYIDSNFIRYMSLTVNDNILTEDKVIHIVNNDYDLIDNIVYNEVFFNLIGSDDYIESNLNRYLSVIGSNLDLITEQVKIIVNNDYDLIDNIVFNDMFFNIIDEPYYIDTKLVDYLSYHNLNTNLTSDEVISHIHAGLNFDYYTNVQATNYDDDILMLVNKYNSLSSNYAPEVVSIESTYGTGTLRSIAYEAFKELYNAALSEGYYIKIQSSYRSYSYQSTLYSNYVNSYGVAAANEFSAKPGHSEHQTGLAIDVGTPSVNFINFGSTKEYLWMKDNAHKYGYILRYEAGKEHLTGYMNEAWHYRYVGIEAATTIYELGITYEEYYTYFIENSN